MKPTFDEALKSAFPAAAVSAALVGRVADLPVARPRRRYFRFVLAGATAALAVVGIGFLAPRAEAFTTLSHIAGAVDALPSWHMVTLTPDSGGRWTKSGETWCLNGRVRDERERGALVRFATSGETIEYRKGDPEAIRLPGRRDADQVLKLSGFVSQFQRSVFMQNVTVERGVEVDGRKATRLRAFATNEPARLTLLADASTDVPFLATVETRRAHGWELQRKVEIDTNPFPRDRVALSLPKGTPVLDRSALREAWIRRMSTPVATLQGQFRPVAIRSVWMNGKGDVFVLYTNGDRGIGATTNTIDLMEVSDSRGTRYVRTEGVQGTMWNTRGEFVDGLVFKGEDVQARVFVPVGEGTPPRSVRLTFGADVFVLPRGFKPKGKMVRMTEMKRVPQYRARFETPIAPAAASLPPWMGFLGSGYRDDLALEADKARTRAQDCIGRGEGVQAERYARDYIRITGLQAASSGMSYAMAGHYQLLGEALFVQGRIEEARANWERALDLSPTGFVADEVRKRLASLPARP